MKRINLILGAVAISVAAASCKNESEAKAEKTVDTYVVYVDSVGSLAAADAKANWEAIDAAYQQRTMEAEAALADMKDREAAQKKLDESKAKYEELKAKIQAEANAGSDRKATLRTSLFPAGTVGDDMSFAWVNKDNILKVYNDFYNEFDKNKENYSREDLDEVKLLYEALDARKNTVEKEGLSGPDNRKIAELKIKFAPKFKWERVTTKGEENKEAKQAAE